jgi:hypothetical protein
VGGGQFGHKTAVSRMTQPGISLPPAYQPDDQPKDFFFFHCHIRPVRQYMIVKTATITPPTRDAKACVRFAILPQIRREHRPATWAATRRGSSLPAANRPGC